MTHVLFSGNIFEVTGVLYPNGIKNQTLKCDDKHKSRLNMHFPTLENAYLHYKEYRRQCGFDVRKSTKRTDISKRSHQVAKSASNGDLFDCLGFYPFHVRRIL